MPRVFVNGLSNFAISGGIVSFSLLDQAMKTVNGEPKLGEPETVVDIVMQEQDFMAMVGRLQNHLEQYKAHQARQGGGFDAAKQAQGPMRLGTSPAQKGSAPMTGPMAAGPGNPGPANPGPGNTGAPGTGMKIRPKS